MMTRSTTKQATLSHRVGVVVADLMSHWDISVRALSRTLEMPEIALQRSLDGTRPFSLVELGGLYSHFGWAPSLIVLAAENGELCTALYSSGYKGPLASPAASGDGQVIDR